MLFQNKHNFEIIRQLVDAASLLQEGGKQYDCNKVLAELGEELIRLKEIQ